MNRWRRILFTVIAAIVLAGLVWEAGRGRQPRYQGKLLTDWLERYSGQISGGAFIPNRNAGLREEAATAIRQIGTNAIPWLLALAAIEDSTTKRWIIGHYPVSNKLAANLLARPFLFRWAAKSDLAPMNAFAGFRCLGPAARPAVPALIQVLHTSKNRNGRFYAIKSLACIGPVETIQAPLISSLKDSDSGLRQTIMYSLLYNPASDGSTPQLRPECAQLLVPALAQALADSKVDALAVIGTLSDMGADAKPAVPAIQPFLTNQNPSIRAAAMKACERISANSSDQ